LTMNQIREELYEHFLHIGAGRKHDAHPRTKNSYRSAHESQRQHKLLQDQIFLIESRARFEKFFADGMDLNLDRFGVRVELVESNGWQSDLFRFVSHYWSVPVSRGFGRRMRFLVWDTSNEKLVGIFALGDAVFNLRIRDSFVGWDAQQRKDRLVSLMDAYVVGAIPPYSQLLCGKLVASLVKSADVADAFRTKYRNAVGLISGERKNPYLAAVTVTSALGRSSIYNRLKLDGDLIFQSLGYTEGWGHFHVPEDLIQKIIDLLRTKKNSNVDAYNFGEGPNWRFRVLRDGLKMLSMDPRLLNHGYQREVFFSAISNNFRQILCGERKRPDYSSLRSVPEISNLALHRWIVPRSISRPDFRAYRKESFLQAVTPYA
jgi:hypothetical protein